ncbi:hypothetical protein SC171_22660 [Pantoea cypripedii]
MAACVKSRKVIGREGLFNDIGGSYLKRTQTLSLKKASDFLSSGYARAAT